MNKKVYIVVLLLTGMMLTMTGPLSAGGKQKIELADMTGRKVQLAVPVRRIVTTFKPSTLCVLSLGLQNRFAGLDTSSRLDRLTRYVFPKVTDLPGVGSKTTGINFETLVSLKPDLVILYSQKDGVQLAKRLQKLGIPSMIIIPESFETIKQSMRLISKAAGVPERMDNIEQQMDQMLSLVEGRLKSIPESDRKKAYFASSKGLFSTTTSSMLQHEIITQAGVVNVSGDLSGYFQNISPEQLVRWNPDIMILSQHIKPGEAKRLADNAIDTIGAVNTRQVFRCPSSLAPWDFPSPLSVLATVWTAKKAYPDQFKDVSVRDTADAFHKALFGKTMTQMGGTLSDRVDW